MKCPRCGRTNGKTNKFCRECGLRLEELVGKETEQHEAGEARTDEVELGEDLFAVLELFEAGDLDAALEKGVKLSLANPESASAHSLVALVCERKSDQEIAEGREEIGRKYLKHAIDCYEAVIDLNPDSTADREKLASLRLKYSGQDAEPAPEPAKTPPTIGFAAALNAIPRPMLAAFGAFLVILALLIVFLPFGKKAPVAVAANPRNAQDSPRVSISENPPAGQPSSGLNVYTFPQATNAGPSTPRVPMPRVETPAPRPAVEDLRPMRVPSVGPELTITPEPKPSRGTLPQLPKVTVTPTPSAASGGSLLAQAIRLHDQGRVQEAIGAANQAIVLYQGDIDAGRGVDAAKRGVANANKLISVWQGALSGGSE